MRKSPSDEPTLASEVQVSLQQQDTEENNAAANTTLQCPWSPTRESTKVKVQQELEAELSSLTEKEANTDIAVQGAFQAFVGQEKMSSPEKNSELGGFRQPPENYAIKDENDEEQMTPEERSTSCQSSTYPLQLPTSEESDGSCAAALEERQGGRGNSPCDSERNEETSQDQLRNVAMGDVKKESVAGLPARKRRRMGMCGPTERERSRVLPANKCENLQNGTKRVERQMCNNEADSTPSLSLHISPPAILLTSVAQPGEGKLQHQSRHCETAHRAETGVLLPVSTSDGADTMLCADTKRESEGPEHTGTLQSDPPPEEKEEYLGNPEQQVAECDNAISHPATHPSRDEDIERQKRGSGDAPLQVHAGGHPIETNEKIQEPCNDAGDCEGPGEEASSIDAQQRELDCDAVELADAAVPSGGSVRNRSSGPDGEPGSGPAIVNGQLPQTVDAVDPFGSGCSDYLSDSQLNNIVWIEAVVEEDGYLRPSDCVEDATDLIRGLIRELSSINRAVMATHRELDNLRRGSKSSSRSKR